ncbi:MAG TPA: helix-turn-helix domain-containing protein [Acidimicrobiales bacterium]|nr:helix-turn-helix domain-containing protein [Acidimicrobiales bacterium]
MSTSTAAVGASPDGPGGQGTDDLAGSGSLLESLLGDFEAFGLSGYEAKVLLALLQLGAAPASEVARVAGLGRTNVYPTIDTLQSKGLAEPVAGKAGVWAVPSRDATVERLIGREEQRLRQLRERGARAQQKLELLGPARAAVPVPYVHTIRGAEDTWACWQRLMASTRSELLVFNRPPYASPPENPNPAVLETLARGVQARALYQRAQLVHPDAEPFRVVHGRYHSAGVEARVVDDLPLKLAIGDRSMVLLAMTDPVAPEIGFPTNLLIEHPGFAAFATAAFEDYWSNAVPYEQVVPPEPEEAMK